MNAEKGISWHEAEEVNSEGGKPAYVFCGAVADLVGGADVQLSISHDAGIATAIVIAAHKL